MNDQTYSCDARGVGGSRSFMRPELRRVEHTLHWTPATGHDHLGGEFGGVVPSLAHLFRIPQPRERPDWKSADQKHSALFAVRSFADGARGDEQRLFSLARRPFVRGRSACFWREFVLFRAESEARLYLPAVSYCEESLNHLAARVGVDDGSVA